MSDLWSVSCKDSTDFIFQMVPWTSSQQHVRDNKQLVFACVSQQGWCRTIPNVLICLYNIIKVIDILLHWIFFSIFRSILYQNCIYYSYWSPGSKLTVLVFYKTLMKDGSGSQNLQSTRQMKDEYKEGCTEEHDCSVPETVSGQWLLRRLNQSLCSFHLFFKWEYWWVPGFSYGEHVP